MYIPVNLYSFNNAFYVRFIDRFWCAPFIVVDGQYKAKKTQRVPIVYNEHCIIFIVLIINIYRNDIILNCIRGD